MTAEASRHRRLGHGRQPRWLLSGAVASLAATIGLAYLLLVIWVIEVVSVDRV